jgi:serine protease Do
MLPRYRLSSWKLGCLLAALCLAARPVGLRAADADLKIPPVFTKAVPESVEDLKAIQDHVKTVLAKVMPATVNVRIGMGQGSGVIVTEDGYVLTAGHVSGIPGREVELTFGDGRKVKGKTLGLNRGIDTGLIKITTEGKWPHVGMGKSGELKKGQWCIAVGHPGGYKPGRTPVVRVGRVLDMGRAVIRTDCALVGGDSGGPLFDMSGNVIGIHSKILGAMTANIHVPVDAYRDGWTALTLNEPYMGVQGDTEGGRCKIQYVSPGSPAEKAGVKIDDIVLRFGDRKINAYEELRAQIQRRRPGDQVVIEVERGDTTVTLKLVVGKRPG